MVVPPPPRHGFRSNIGSSGLSILPRVRGREPDEEAGGERDRGGRGAQIGGVGGAALRPPLQRPPSGEGLRPPALRRPRPCYD